MKKIRLYYLIDASDKNMEDYALKVATWVNETVSLMQTIEIDYRAEVTARIMVYEAWAKWFTDKEDSLYNWIITHIKYSGKSEFGNALNLLGADLADSEEGVCPVIIYIPCATPTDDYKSVIKKLKRLDAYKDALKLAIDIGNKCDGDIAYEFVGTASKIIAHNKLEVLKHFLLSAMEDYYREHEEVYAPSKKNWYSEENNRDADVIHPGKDKCDKLREIRKMIAEANGIPYEPIECHHTGPCRGTCPACDAEIKYLDDEIQKKIARGERVTLSGIVTDKKLCNHDDNIDKNFSFGGEMPADNSYDNMIPDGRYSPDSEDEDDVRGIDSLSERDPETMVCGMMHVIDDFGDDDFSGDEL